MINEVLIVGEGEKLLQQIEFNLMFYRAESIPQLIEINWDSLNFRKKQKHKTMSFRYIEHQGRRA
jgi:hypothetical protein